MEPTFFLINKQWHDEEIRTNFLETIGELLTIIREYKDYFNVIVPEDFIYLFWESSNNIFKYDKKLRQELFEPLLNLLKPFPVSDNFICGHIIPALNSHLDTCIWENLIAAIHAILLK